MSGFAVRGWCPGALRPMASGDGLVVRVRAPAGRLTPAQAAGLAAAASAHGNGLIDLSSRANLQIRGVTEESHPGLVTALAALGLVEDDLEAEARGNILHAPFGEEPQLASALRLALRAGPALPSKFGFAIDTCPEGRWLADASADIRLERGATGELLLRADGAALGLPVAPETAAATALAMANWFVASGGVQAGRGRMAAHLARAALPAGLAGSRPPAPALAAPGPGLRPEGALLAPSLGQMKASTLARLAALGHPLRLTPWRMLLLEGARALPALAHLVTDPADPLLRVVACTGAPGCVQGLAPTRALARGLAAHVPPGQLLHVSGCAKGCAHPGAAPHVLVATTEGFDLVRAGRAADPPLIRDLSPERLADPRLFDDTADPDAGVASTHLQDPEAS